MRSIKKKRQIKMAKNGNCSFAELPPEFFDAGTAPVKKKNDCRPRRIISGLVDRLDRVHYPP